MTAATGPMFLTRGTQAKVDAVPTDRAGRIVSSVNDPDPDARRVYVDDVDGIRRALAWLDDVGAGGTTPPTVPDNAKPDVSGLVVTGWPAEVYPGQSFDITISGATDPDGDDAAITYSLACSSTTANKTTGIRSGESVTITVGMSATIGGTAGISATAVDGDNVESDPVSKSADVVSPSGSVTRYSSGTVSIPAGVTAITVRGHGSPGSAESVPNSGTATNPFGDHNFTDCPELNNFPASISVTNGVWPYVNGIPPSDSFVNASVRYYYCPDTVLSNSSVVYYLAAVPASPGDAATVTGAVSHTFAGAATGVTAAPATTEIVLTLPDSSGHTLTLTVPSGAMIEIEW